MSRISTRGLVLRRLPYSETSQIVWVFTRDHGVLHVMAKGSLRLARKSSSFPAPFDGAGWYDMVIRAGRGDVHQVYEARLVEGFDHLRRSLPCYLDAQFALEVMLKMFSPGDPHPQFLRGALAYLKLLGVGKGRRVLRNHFYGQMLLETGFSPDWSACTECGEAPEGSQVAVWVPRGFLCSNCRQGSEERVTRQVVEYLAAEAQVPWGRVPGLSVETAILESSWRLLRSILLYHLERPPHSLRYLLD